MKSFRIFTALAIILSFFFASCECNLPDDTIRFSELPEATSEGLHTFGCIVDGRRWAVGSYEDLRASVGPDRLSLTAEGQHLTKLKEIYIYLETNTPIRTGIDYEIDGSMEARISGHTENRECRFGSNLHHNEGWIRFSRYDLPTWNSPGIISGEFEATMLGESAKCGRREITRGRFDVVIIHQ